MQDQPMIRATWRCAFYWQKTVRSFASSYGCGAQNALLADVVNQKVALKFLEGNGHKIDVVENGALAVEAFKKKCYDVSGHLRRLPIGSSTDMSFRCRA